MKLPDDPKKRQQVLILIGMVAVIVAVVAWMFGIQPFLKNRSDMLADIEKKTGELTTARDEVAKAPGNREMNRQTLKKINDISEKYVIQPRTGLNYHLAAREILEKVATSVGIETEPIVNVGTGSLLGGGQKDPSKHVKACTAIVTAKCGYGDIVRFVRTLEKENPYMSISRVSVVGRPAEDKKKHSITIEVQWPAWIDPSYPETLDVSIKKAEMVSPSSTPGKETTDAKQKGKG